MKDITFNTIILLNSLFYCIYMSNCGIAISYYWNVIYTSPKNAECVLCKMHTLLGI